MLIEIALLVIVILLVVILALQFAQLRLYRIWMSGLQELLAERLESSNSDIKKFWKKKNYAKIVSEITDKRLENSRDPELYWYKGLSLFYLNQLNEARPVLEGAVELDPSFEKTLAPYLKRIDDTVIDAPNDSPPQPGHE